MNRIYIFFLVTFFITQLNGQGTFSIVAVDSITGQVGSAGGSCVDYVANNYTPGRIGDLIPGVGAINSQAFLLPGNQTIARTRMLAGDSPNEIILLLILNDVGNNPTRRQYGIVDFNEGSPRSAAYTGANSFDYKNHILGPNYSIQGNTLLGQEVLDSMEARFLAEQGGLACKLMAALQGANMVGADTRCATNGTSALYAYVKVAEPTDEIDTPSFFVGVKTSAGAGIEPIDSLQVLFDQTASCMVSATETINKGPDIAIYPNPIGDRLQIECGNCDYNEHEIMITDMFGRIIFDTTLVKKQTIATSNWGKGVYFVLLNINGERMIRKLVKH